MTHQEKLQWMALWAATNCLQLVLEGECGFGRECVGVSVNGVYPDYSWYTETNDGFKQADNNGKVWTPPDAYHKHDCVAVLGRGESAESQLYDWLKWFDENNFKLETGVVDMDPKLGLMGILLNKHRYARFVRQEPTNTDVK